MVTIVLVAQHLMCPCLLLIARQINGWMYEQTYGWTDRGQADQEMDGWMDEWMDGWINGWLDGWINGWLDGWMDGWMDGWID